MAVKMVKKAKVNADKLDPIGFMDSLGLYSKYAMIDTLAQTKGMDSGHVQLTTNSLDKTAYIELYLADYVHTIEADLEGDTLTEESLLMVKESVGQFLKEMAYKLGAVEKSPAMVFMDAAKSLAEGIGANVDDGVEYTIPTGSLVTSEALCADPALGAVELDKATELYQAVFGTSAGSRYHLVLADNRMKLAARYKKSGSGAGSLSMKAIVCYDTPPSGKVVNKDTLLECFKPFGMSVKDAGHCSGHLQCSVTVAQQTLLALMTVFDMGSMKFGVPNLEKFMEYGA